MMSYGCFLFNHYWTSWCSDIFVKWNTTGMVVAFGVLTFGVFVRLFVLASFLVMAALMARSVVPQFLKLMMHLSSQVANNSTALYDSGWEVLLQHCNFELIQESLWISKSALYISFWSLGSSEICASRRNGCWYSSCSISVSLIHVNVVCIKWKKLVIVQTNELYQLTAVAFCLLVAWVHVFFNPLFYFLCISLWFCNLAFIWQGFWVVTFCHKNFPAFTKQVLFIIYLY